MQNTTKLVFAGLAATILMSLAVGSASARRIETSEQGFLARWTTESPLIFSAAGNRVSCPVTLEGSFHSKTLSKVCGQLVGHISTAQVPPASPPCQGGTATALTETLPWHIQYVSFAGTLPRITRIRLQLVGARFAITAGGVTCLAGTTQAHPAVSDVNVSATTGEATSLRALPEFTIPLGGEFICGFAGNGSFEGTTRILGSLVATPRDRKSVV